MCSASGSRPSQAPGHPELVGQLLRGPAANRSRARSGAPRPVASTAGSPRIAAHPRGIVQCGDLHRPGRSLSRHGARGGALRRRTGVAGSTVISGGSAALCSMPSSARPRIAAVAKYGLADGSTIFTSTLAPCGLPWVRGAGTALPPPGSRCPSRRRPPPSCPAASAVRTRSSRRRSAAPRSARRRSRRSRCSPSGVMPCAPVPPENTGELPVAAARSAGGHRIPRCRRTAPATG